MIARDASRASLRAACNVDTRRVLAGIAVAAALVLLASLDAAVRPRLLTIDGGRAERATGFAIRDETVLTVAHAVEGPVRVDGRPATVTRVDQEADLALLHVPGLRAPALRSARVVPGEPTSAGTVRRVIRASVDGRVRDALELAGDVQAGQSGTPVLTRDGRIAGVVFGRSERRPHTVYATVLTLH